jgi:hypothetical protein
MLVCFSSIYSIYTSPSVSTFAVVAYLILLFRFSVKEVEVVSATNILTFFHLLIFILGLLSLISPSTVIAIFDLVYNRDLSYLDYSGSIGTNYRVSGIFQNPNYFAQISLIILLFIFSVYRYQPFLNRVVSFNFFLCFFCVLLSGSRAGLLGVSIFLLYYLFSYRKYLYIITFGSLGIILLPLFATRIRSLDFSSLLDPNNTSGLVRIKQLAEYISGLYNNSNLTPLFIGTGRREDLGIVFDSDFGNFFFQFGGFGCLVFAAYLIFNSRSNNNFYVLLCLFPFFYAGGILSNLKLLVVYVLLFNVIFLDQRRVRYGIRL